MRQPNAHLGFALMIVLLVASPVWAQDELDFGDAPEFQDPDTGAIIGYPTRLVPLDGARHLIRGPWLGGPNDRPDAEADGQPHPQALGDNNNGSNDENGVVISGPLVIGTTPTITIEVNSDDGAGGTVSGWVDYDGDRKWDTSEQVVGASYLNGTYNVTFPGPVPSTAVTGPTFARFRISNDSAARFPEGLAADGEVEDYLVYIRRGPVEIDVFPDVSMDLTLTMPDGSSEAVSLTGPMEMHVFFEGFNEGDAKDDDGNGKEEVETEIVSLNLSGQSSMGPVQVRLNPNRSSVGVMEERVNSTLGLLDVNPFAEGEMESFFDISFEIILNTPSGPVVLVNQQPLRLAGVFTEKPPPPCEDYTSTNSVELFDEDGHSTGISIAAAVLKPSPCYLDWGDAPEQWDDVTGALIGYPTTLAADGARHIIRGPWLGEPYDRPDPETDGQPHPQALGDDINDDDDEDGVTMPAVLIHSVPVDITILVSGGIVGGGPDGYVNGWIDYNGNRTWEAAEQVISGWQPAGPLTVTVTAPAGSVVGPTFARFRINSRSNIGPTGQAVDGEAEDYLVYIRRGPVEIDIFEDASMDLTLTTPDGSSEDVSLTGPTEMDVYFEGFEEGDAEDDDGNGRDEVETEIVSLSLTGQSGMGTVQVTMNPNMSSVGVMEERVNATLTVLDIPPFVPSQGDLFLVDSFFDVYFEITVDLGSGPQVLVNQDPLRLAGVITEKPPAECDEYTSTNTSPVQLYDELGRPTGLSIATAVLKPRPCPLDWGDAPEIAGTLMLYPTLAPNGARHRIVNNVYLGNTTITDTTILPIDAENNGQPTIGADGDDVLDLNDDEDGIRFLTWPLRPGRPAKIEVRASVDGYLSAWIDFDADGGWAEADDYIAFDGAAAAGPLAIPAGTTVHVFQVPTSAKPNSKTYSRFRFATYPITTFEGYARDGEVEDYLVKIRSHPGIKWIQRPDETKLGIDIRVDNNDGIQRVLADDFECTSYGYITDVHLWGSWKDDDKGNITNIHLSIHSDDPASAEPGDTFSKPDRLLWEGDFSPDQFKERFHASVDDGEFWWDPYRNVWQSPGDYRIWQVDINIHPKAAFLQEGSPDEPIVYWLDVAVRTDGGEFGWKTRRWPKHYNDDAVRSLLDVDGNQIGWQDLQYPDQHPHTLDSIDMAFVVTTDNAVTGSGDLNGDHDINITDLSIYAAEYEPGVQQFPK